MNNRPLPPVIAVGCFAPMPPIAFLYRGYLSFGFTEPGHFGRVSPSVAEQEVKAKHTKLIGGEPVVMKFVKIRRPPKTDRSLERQ